MISPEWKRRAKIGLKAVSKTAELLIQVRNRPGVVECVAAGARALDSLADAADSDLPRNYFDSWAYMGSQVCYREQLFKLCRDRGYLRPTGDRRDGEQAFTCDLQGVHLGWVLEGTSIQGPWVENAEPEVAVAVFRTLLWREIGFNLLHVKGKTWESSYLVRDRLDEALPSQAAEALWERIEKFASQGKRRSLMLHGEPGTGKSHAIRFVANRAGGLTLRFRAEHCTSNSAADVISFLQPDAVLIDDLCKAAYSGTFTEAFDEIRSTAKLFLVTANDLTRLDAALLRRFDDAFEVQGIDPGVFAKMTEGFSPAVVERLRGLPTDWVAKYRELHDVLGAEQAESELEGILGRRRQVLTQMRNPPPRVSDKAEEVE